MIISKTTRGIIIFIVIIIALCAVSSIWLSGAGLFPLFASIGGMIVFLGLWIEKEADDAEKGTHLISQTKRKSKIGWMILMSGIAVEICTASILGIRDEWNNWQNNPWNGQILDLSSDVYFEVEGTNSPLPTWGQPSNVGFMLLCNASPTFPQTGSAIFPIYADNYNFGYAVTTNIDWNPNRSYSIRFHTEGTAAFMAGSGMTFPVRKVSDVKLLYMALKFLPRNTKVLGGTADVVVNERIHKLFEILPQTPDFNSLSNYVIVAATNESAAR